VYRKACREYNVDNYVFTWSEELEEQLVRLVTVITISNWFLQ
jgi:hypothetical protein